MDILKALGIHRWFLLCLGMWVQPGREEDVMLRADTAARWLSPDGWRIRVGEREKEVAGDLGAAVGQGEDLRAQPKAIS